MQTVTVACKLPNGLHLEVKDASGATVRHTVHGSRLPVDKDGNKIAAFELAGNQTYGLTPGIPKEFWDKWESENQRYPPYAQGMIFAHEKSGNARAQATELKDVRTGLEPMPQKAPGIEPVKSDSLG